MLFVGSFCDLHMFNVSKTKRPAGPRLDLKMSASIFRKQPLVIVEDARRIVLYQDNAGFDAPGEHIICAPFMEHSVVEVFSVC